MCFSATASFGASAALAAAGGYSVKKIENNRELPLASIPLFFAVQQFAEGLVWVGLLMNQQNAIAIHTFLFFALFFWPIFIPFAMFMFEPNRIRKHILAWAMVAGLIIGVSLLTNQSNHVITAEVIQSTIYYSIFTKSFGVLAFLYVIITMGSLIISSHRWLNMLGILGTIGVVSAIEVFPDTYPSVWCFEAALISIIIAWYFWRRQKKV